jgi:positive regulator of sigma E activity
MGTIALAVFVALIIVILTGATIHNRLLSKVAESDSPFIGIPSSLFLFLAHLVYINAFNVLIVGTWFGGAAVFAKITTECFNTGTLAGKIFGIIFAILCWMWIIFAPRIAELWLKNKAGNEEHAK